MDMDIEQMTEEVKSGLIKCLQYFQDEIIRLKEKLHQKDELIAQMQQARNIFDVVCIYVSVIASVFARFIFWLNNICDDIAASSSVQFYSRVCTGKT